MLLWVEYNPFADLASLLIMTCISLLCVLTKKICFYIGKCLKIWKIPESQEWKDEMKVNEETFPQQYTRIFEQRMTGMRTNLEIKPSYHFDTTKWKLIERVRIEEEINRNDLQTDRVMAQTFRDVFLKYNQPWLQK